MDSGSSSQHRSRVSVTSRSHRDAASTWLVRAIIGYAGYTTISMACIIHDETIISITDGYRWCADLNGAKGHTNDPDEEVWQAILDPNSDSEPQGCICLDGEQHELIQAGIAAAVSMDPPPEGYNDLLEEIRLAAQTHCQAIATDASPQFVHNNCLFPSLTIGIPEQVGMSGECQICQEATVSNGHIEEIPCPGGGTGGGTGGGAGGGAGGEPSDDTASPGTGVDETGTGEGSGLNCSEWETLDSISYQHYTSGRPIGGYSNVDEGLVELALTHDLAGLLACDEARYSQNSYGDWVISEAVMGDLLYEIGLRNGDQNLEVRAYDPVAGSGHTPWYPLNSYQAMAGVLDNLRTYTYIQLKFEDPSVPPSGRRFLYVQAMDCNTLAGIVCPTP